MFRPAEPISALHPETQPSTQPAETQPFAVELAATMPARDPFLGQGDEVEIKVYRQDDLVRQFIVRPSAAPLA